MYGCAPETTRNGMPFGAPSQTVPKSGGRPVLRPMLAMRAAECGSTGAVEMSWFQGLSAGNTCWPSIKAPPLVVPAGVTGGRGAGAGVGGGDGLGAAEGAGGGGGVYLQ